MSECLFSLLYMRVFFYKTGTVGKLSLLFNIGHLIQNYSLTVAFIVINFIKKMVLILINLSEKEKQSLAAW